VRKERGEAPELPPLSTVHVVTTSQEEGDHVRARGPALGARLVNIFSRHFEHWLPEAERQWLIVDLVGSTTSLPAEYQAKYLPEPLQAIAARAAHGRLDHTLTDGTHVVVLYAPDISSLLQQLDQLSLP
jgi:hypothetical protein